MGKTEAIHISPDSIAHRAYASNGAMERFRCNYGLNPHYLPYFTNAPLKVTGRDGAGDARIVELSNHPFFLATLFLPQLRSQPGAPHPLVLAYLAAASAFRDGGVVAA